MALAPDPDTTWGNPTNVAPGTTTTTTTSGGGGGGTGGTGTTTTASDPTHSYWYTLWMHIGFDSATAYKAARAGLASPSDLSQMFHIIRTSTQYRTLFPGIDQLSQSQNWNFATLDDSPEAEYYKWKSNISNYAKQYGFQLATADYAHYAFRGWGQGDVNSFFQGRQWVNTNQKDLNYYLGNFEKMQLSQSQLEQLAEAEGGLPNKQGSQLEKLFEEGQRRAANAFQGVTGKLGNIPTYTNPMANPDTGAT